MKLFQTILSLAVLTSGLSAHAGFGPRTEEIHQRLDQCRQSEVMCLGHALIDMAFGVAGMLQGGYGPGPGPGPGFPPGPVGPGYPPPKIVTVEFRYNNWGGCSYGNSTVALVGFQAGNFAENLKRCQLLADNYKDMRVNAVKVETCTTFQETSFLAACQAQASLY